MGQVVTQRELMLRRGEWKRTGEGMVCAYGAFDLLHPGHVRLFEQAREFGNILVVAVQSDALVRADATGVGDETARRNDAGERPVTPDAERAEIVAALNAVDFASVVDIPLVAFVKIFQPDVFVCGDEVNAAREVESALAEAGCKVVRLPLEPGYSTTLLIERIAGHRA